MLLSLDSSTRAISGVPIFPATTAGKPALGQNMADERSRRGFSIRAGHADQPSSQEAPAQFDFAPDGHARGARRHQTRVVRRHARAGHDQILRRERGQRAVARAPDAPPK